MSKVTITAQIMEIDYEITMRQRVYSRRVSKGDMKQAEADMHMAQIGAVRETLLFCRDHEQAIREWMAEGRRS